MAMDQKLLTDLDAWLGVSGLSTEGLKSQCALPQVQEILERFGRALVDRRKSRAAFEAFPGHISWVSRELTYLGVNEELAQSVGLVPEDFIGKPLGFVNKDSPFSNFVREFIRGDLMDDRQVLEVYMPHLKESRWISVVARKYDGGQASVVIGLDVTELRHVQHLVADLQRKETHMMRLATLGELAAGMTHEINNPLTVITTGLYTLREYLEESGPIEPQMQDIFKMMNKATAHVVKIVDGARHLARGESKNPFAEAYLKEIVQDALILCGEKIKSTGVLVTQDIDPKLALDCHQSSILQVIINLLSNGCDALVDQDIPYEKRWINLSATEDKNQLILMITDSGPGIPATIRGTMFQPFFTTKPAGKGTGLGLSIAKSQVDLHHGKIYVDSSHPHTRFVIELPLKQKL